MTTLTPAAALTEEEAMTGYRAVVATLARVFGDDAVAADHPVRQGEHWPEGPVLVADFDIGFGPTAWAVVWETGPYFWADYIPSGGVYAELGFPLIVPPTELPPGVGTDTFSSSAASLYRKTPVVLP